MQIICPDCQFAREVDETKIPAKSQVATCPKCKTKFKFRELPEDDFTLEEPVEPAPVAKKPTQPAQGTLPLSDDPEPTFPKMTAPGENPKEELWDKLGDMAPPETAPEAEATQPETAQQQTPVEQPPTEQAPTEQAPPQQASQSSEEQPPVEGWTGEFNSDFPDPMQNELLEDDEENESSLSVPPPFEQLDRYGFFRGLVLTVKLILTSPRLFFAVMPVGGGLAKPLTYAILVAMIQVLAQLAWGAAGLTVGLDIVGQEIVAVPYNISGGIFDLLFTPAAVAMTLFIFSGFYHLLFILVQSDKRGFEGTMRAVAYGYTPIVTGLFPMPSITVLATWLFVYAVWSLVLTTIGFKHIHQMSYARAIPVIIIPILLVMLLALAMAQSQLATI